MKSQILNSMTFDNILSKRIISKHIFLCSLMTVVVFISIPIAGFTQMGSTKDAWIRIDEGHALYLHPQSLEWVPAIDNHKIPLQTYIITKQNTVSFIYFETSVYELPDNSYFFLEDVLQKDSIQVVKHLTVIEANELPAVYDEPQNLKQKLGVTYGFKSNDDSVDNSSAQIPFEIERKNAIDWFVTRNQYQAALFSLKRTLTKFPFLYSDYDKFDLLCNIYERLGLYGFLYNDSNRVLQMDTDEKVRAVAKKWYSEAEKNMRVKRP